MRSPGHVDCATKEDIKTLSLPLFLTLGILVTGVGMRGGYVAPPFYSTDTSQQTSNNGNDQTRLKPPKIYDKIISYKMTSKPLVIMTIKEIIISVHNHI